MNMIVQVNKYTGNNTIMSILMLRKASVGMLRLKEVQRRNGVVMTDRQDEHPPTGDSAAAPMLETRSRNRALYWMN